MHADLVTVRIVHCELIPCMTGQFDSLKHGSVQWLLVLHRKTPSASNKKEKDTAKGRKFNNQIKDLRVAGVAGIQVPPAELPAMPRRLPAPHHPLQLAISTSSLAGTGNLTLVRVNA